MWVFSHQLTQVEVMTSPKSRNPASEATTMFEASVAMVTGNVASEADKACS